MSLNALCKELIGHDSSDALAVQIKRVLIRITNEEQRDKIQEPRDIVAMYRAKGLLTRTAKPMSKDKRTIDKLEEHCKRLKDLSDTEAQTRSVCFAACIYPNRTYRMPETEFRLRLESFLQWFPVLVRFTTAEEIAGVVIRNLPQMQTVMQENISELLSDLSAATIVTSQQHEDAERQNGAAFYLATCYPERIQRMYSYWQTDDWFVRFLVTTPLTTPPSKYTKEYEQAKGWPDWHRVKNQLPAALRQGPSKHHDMAVELEKTAWNKASKIMSPSSFSCIAEAVDEFWGKRWDKLISGYPYYAFLSLFKTWWWQCLETHIWPPIEITLHDDKGGTVEPDDDKQLSIDESNGLPVDLSESGICSPEESADASANELPPDCVESVVVSSPDDDDASQFECTPEALRPFREVYRLVRTTFFARDNPAETETLRKALDALWYCRLEKQMGDDLQAEAVKEIACKLKIPETTINNLNHRLHYRLWACTLARTHCFTISEIPSVRRPHGARRNMPEYPFANEPGVLKVASLAWNVPRKHSLFWVFTAHVFLSPEIDPQHADRWTFKRLLRELWWWVTEQGFVKAICRGAKKGNRADQAALSAMEQSPFKELLQDLRGLKSEDDLERYVGEREFHSEYEAVCGILWQWTGDDRFHKCIRGVLRVWRRKIDRHWIVPVWYLTVVEQLREEQVVSRLQVETNEKEMVVGLLKAIAACRNSSPAPSSPAVSGQGSLVSSVRKRP